MNTQEIQYFITPVYDRASHGRSAALIPRLHDTTGCRTGWTTGLTIACIL